MSIRFTMKNDKTGHKTVIERPVKRDSQRALANEICRMKGIK